MGMYTEIMVTGSIPEHEVEAVEILHFLFAGQPLPALPGGMSLPDHKFFTLSRWSMIGRCSSYYFATHEPHNVVEYVEDGERYLFTSVSNIKNYSNEIDEFFNWLSTTDADYFGYSRYEETPLKVTYYYSRNVKDCY